MSKFNLSCPQNNDRECEHCHGVNAQDGWRFRGCFFPPNKGKYVAEIKECPLKHRKEKRYDIYNRRNIYRVVCTDQYQSTTPETCWTTDKQSCEEYIANSYYKHCLGIEKSRLSDKAVKL